jgi:putative transposase
MPWKETCVMDERVKFIADWLSQGYTITELSERYEVSRKTLYKWLDRYGTGGLEGLKERSRAPINRPWATNPEIISTILGAKSKHITWGPRKLIGYLERRHPEKAWPAISTAQAILKREGWVKTQHKRHHTPGYTRPFLPVTAANDVWSADFKGQFRLGNGKLCYPLTLTDNYSRYLLACQGLYSPNLSETKSILERAFQQYGLPLAIRTDNGVPFASTALGGLSSLSVWFIKLGILPERIEPGQPQQNGKHERFHRTLGEETINPPRPNLPKQQRCFDRFEYVYNHERPHEALGQQPPASVYRPSTRSYPSKLAEIEYENNMTIRQVRLGGRMKWKGGLIYVSKTLIGEPIGLRQIEDQAWEVYYSSFQLGILNETLGRIIQP